MYLFLRFTFQEKEIHIFPNILGWAMKVINQAEINRLMIDSELISIIN